MDMIVDGWLAFRSSGFGSVATSVEAQRIYAWLGLGAVMIISLNAARLQLGLLKGVRVAELDADMRIPGPVPTKPESIQRQIAWFEAKRQDVVGGVWQAVGLMLVLGLVIPGGVVFAAVWLNDWLLPDYAAPILVGGSTSAGMQAASLGDVLVFLVDQVFRGALADIPEVFQLGLTPVSNNPDNAVISWLIVIYRFAAGAVSGAAIYMVYRVWRGVPRIDRRIREYRSRLADAEARIGAAA